MPKQAISDEEVMAAVNAEVGTAREVLHFVHGHPELGHKEHEFRPMSPRPWPAAAFRWSAASAAWLRRFARP